MAWRNPFKRNPTHTAITAAVVRATQRFNTDQVRRADRRVTEAWDIFRYVGEVHYATTQQARLVSRLGWTLKVDGKEFEEDDADKVLTATFGNLNRRRDLQRVAALHLQVAGGYHLTKTGDTWEILRNPAEGPIKKKLEQADLVVTVENPDPADDTRLDSPVLAALDLGRELILARGQSRAQARSRTAQLNTLFYPIEGAGQDRDTFEADLMDTMTAPLADEMSASSVVPNIIGFPAEMIDKIKTIDLTGDLDEKLHERIDKLIEQLARILDIPVELLLGSGDANHWAAWLISEDNYLNHVEPLASPIGEGFAQAMEMILADSGKQVDVEIEPNPSNLLKRRPTIENILTAHRDGVAKTEWAAEQMGIPEESIGDGVPLRTSNGTRGTVEDVASEEPATTAAIEPAETDGVIDAQAIDPAQLADLDVMFGEQMTDLVSDGAERALERLGAQLRSMAQGGNIELPDVPNRDVAIAYTQTIPNEASSVTSTAERFRPQFDRFVTRAFDKIRTAGLDVTPDQGDIESAYAAYVAEVATVTAARRAGRPGDAEAWAASLRINAILGGNGDPSTQPVVSATGFPSSPAGIALGARAVSAMAAQYGVVPGKGFGTTPTPALPRTPSMSS